MYHRKRISGSLWHGEGSFERLDDALSNDKKRMKSAAGWVFGA